MIIFVYSSSYAWHVMLCGKNNAKLTFALHFYRFCIDGGDGENDCVGVLQILFRYWFRRFCQMGLNQIIFMRRLFLVLFFNTLRHFHIHWRVVPVLLCCSP